MKILLDIPDKKSELLLDIREAVDEIKQIKAGKDSSRSAREFLSEL